MPREVLGFVFFRFKIKEECCIELWTCIHFHGDIVWLTGLEGLKFCSPKYCLRYVKYSVINILLEQKKKKTEKGLMKITEVIISCNLFALQTKT